MRIVLRKMQLRLGCHKCIITIDLTLILDLVLASNLICKTFEVVKSSKILDN